MALHWLAADATACFGVALPWAALAIMVGRMLVVKISPSAALAAPGYPTFVVHCWEEASSASLSAGSHPVEQELLDLVDVRRPFGDDVAADDVLTGDALPGRPLERGHEEDVVGDARAGRLRGPVGGDRVEAVGELAGDQPLVVGGGGPA